MSSFHNAPSEDGNIVYMNLTANVEGEEAAEPEETFITLGQEEFGAEFDQELTGVSTGDTNWIFSITYGDDTWQEDWQGKTVRLFCGGNRCYQLPYSGI